MTRVALTAREASMVLSNPFAPWAESIGHRRAVQLGLCLVELLRAPSTDAIAACIRVRS